MAVDWDFTPLYPARVRREGPTVLKTRLEDKKILARRKDANVVRIHRETHVFDRTDLSTALAFFRTKGTDVAFTRRNYDAEDPSDTTVGNWRFRRPIAYAWDGADSYPTVVEFEEDLNT